MARAKREIAFSIVVVSAARASPSSCDNLMISAVSADTACSTSLFCSDMKCPLKNVLSLHYTRCSDHSTRDSGAKGCVNDLGSSFPRRLCPRNDCGIAEAYREVH